ncbi:MAG: class I SAM-dependent rRNA methyltransferase [Chloroflexaceae bacterium]|nr:class I SAM-dependent rRNA methyltransferase [Chloroflexaceae bacterium]
MNLPEITAQPAIKLRLLAGHPWVYRNHVSGGEGLRSGTWVRLRCGNFTAVGLWDASSAIAVRLFTRRDVPSGPWLAEQVWDAWELRESVRAGETDAYRWIYGEGDGLPGLVVDRYGGYAVVRTYAESVAALLPWLVPALRQCDPELRGVLARGAAADAASERDEHDGSQLQLLWGEKPPADLVVQEQGLYFHADLFSGQKTGLFLDQRENRHTVERLAGGLRVLNCFAYTGGFSLYALRGGADHVISVDIGQGLAEAAAANMQLNRLDLSRHQFVTEDCFALLDTYAKAGRTFDMIILDPPSFAKTRANLHAATRAYTRLNSLALRCLLPGGLLVSASCTSQIGPEAFRDMLAEAGSSASRRLQIIHEAGHPVDHPVPAGFPEGRYLKFIVARAMPVQ